MKSFVLPIISDNKQGVVSALDASPSFDYFEIWLDYIKDLDSRFVADLIERHSKKLIFLLRRMNFEPRELKPALQEELIRAISESDAMIDLDLFDQRDELDRFGTQLNSRLILSYHNYKVTPSRAELHQILFKMEQFQARTLKIACYCNSYTDTLRLLDLEINLSEKGRSHVVLGMGSYGKITRLMGPLVGSELIYTPLTLNESSASGQIVYAELKRILDTLQQ